MIENIEKILRKAPQPKMPAELREKLQADIVLPNRVGQAKARTTNDWRPWLRRWIPAVSFSALLLASLVAIAVQANILSELRRENRELQVAVTDVEQGQRPSANSQSAVQLRLEQLRKDAVEAERLREEIAGLSSQTGALAGLRAENQQLKARLQAAQSQIAGATQEEAFATAQEKAKSVQCVSNLKQIGLAARMWANDHQDIHPPGPAGDAERVELAQNPCLPR